MHAIYNSFFLVIQLFTYSLHQGIFYSIYNIAMYYIIELKQNNEMKIRRNFLKDGHKMVVLQQIFKENNIKLVEDGYNIDEAGLYCVKCGLDTYRLFRLITEADGYLFYGRKYEVDVSYLKILYYVNDLDGLEGVGEQLKQLGLKEKVEEDQKKEKVRKQRKKEQEEMKRE